MKPKVAIVRGKFLNAYEMQFFEPLTEQFAITGFGSRTAFHTQFSFPTKLLASPMDWPTFPYSLSLYNRIFTDAQYLFGLEKAVEGYDLVHTAETYYSYTQQCLNAKKQGKVKKVIATVLENIPFNNEGISGRKVFKQRARNELDHIIALTDRTKAALLLEGADERKITVISHFIDTKRFEQKSKVKSQKSKFNLLFCGRLEKYKGVYEIVRALKLLLLDKEIGNIFQMTFVGDGSEKEAMKQEIERLGITELITFRQVSYQDMPAVYQEADIYLAPSKSSGTWIEQYNTTLLEAQAAGLPIVTTYSGGIPENVAEAAVLVPPEDSYALYLAIKEFILDPSKRESFGMKARQRAETVHDISIGAKKIAEVWYNVLAS